MRLPPNDGSRFYCLRNFVSFNPRNIQTDLAGQADKWSAGRGFSAAMIALMKESNLKYSLLPMRDEIENPTWYLGYDSKRNSPLTP
jgi:hypothetical protein